MEKLTTKEHKREYQKEYFKKNKGSLSEKRKRRWQAYTAEQRDELRLQNRRYKWAIKREVLTYYGKGKCACVMCGFDDLRALTIDHINGGGTQERMTAGKGLNWGGVPFYRWLKREGYPMGYQTLCMNCQLIKKVVFPI